MYQNILVINLMHIGDLMLATPVLRTLRANFPQARISLLADRKLADLVRCNPHIDECLLLDKKGKDDHWGSLWRFIRGIRRRKFDLVINLHRNERASAIAAFSGAGRIVGYSKPFFSLFFDKVMPNPAIARHRGLWGKRYVPGWKHQVTAHLDVLREAVGVTAIDDGGLELAVPEEAEREAEQLWQESFAAGEKVVALNIGASWETKRWLAASFAEAADRLVGRGYAVAFFGGPMDEAMVAACRARMQQGNSEKVRAFTGRVSLAVLAGLLGRCSLMITTDSGPMHVGVAMNVPIVTMFGASPVPGFSPYDAKDVLIQSPAPCHPCGLHRCPKQGEENLACMKAIGVDAVMRYAEELLERYEGKPAHTLPAHYGAYACRVVKP